MQTLTTLNARHCPAITAHLCALGIGDRSDRFMAGVSDDYISRYVHGIGFARDILIGAHQDQRLVGFAHAATHVQQGEQVMELGLSVDSGLRRQGVGRRLLTAAMRAAQALGVARMDIMFRARNPAMAALTRRLGGQVTRQGAESNAQFRLMPAHALPLQLRHSATGAERLQAWHPQERGRALLVHGAGGDSFQWLPQVLPALWAAGFSVCAPTLPGHGREADPALATLHDLQACLTQAADDFSPTLIVGHSMGGYLVQRHLQRRTVERVVLLASLPPHVPDEGQLAGALAQLHCPLAQQAARTALADAPDVAGQPTTARVCVIGGEYDRVVHKAWVCDTAHRYGVAAQFVAGGHCLMQGRAAAEVMALLAA
jgi:GNAT superfamily N-acetyltransferase